MSAAVSRSGQFRPWDVQLRMDTGSSMLSLHRFSHSASDHACAASCPESCWNASTISPSASPSPSTMRYCASTLRVRGERCWTSGRSETGRRLRCRSMGEGAWWAWRLAEVGTGGPRRRRRAAGEEVEAGEEGSSQKDIEGCVTVKASEGVDLVVKMVADPKSCVEELRGGRKDGCRPEVGVEELRGGRKDGRRPEVVR